MKRQNNNIPCWQCRYGAKPGHMEQCRCPQVQDLSLLDLLPNPDTETIFALGYMYGRTDAKGNADTFKPAPFAVVSMAVGEGACKYFKPLPDGSQRK